MRKMMVLVGVAAAMAGCAEPGQPAAFIEGVLPLTPPSCVASAGSSTFVGTALLDIGTDAATANSLILPLKLRAGLPSTFTTQDLQADEQRSPNYVNYGHVDNNVITFEESEVFFTTDEDREAGPALVNADTPVNDTSKRVTSLSGVAFNTQTTLLSESVVFATAITKQDAENLQDEPFINDALIAQNPNGVTANRARVIVNLRLVGRTTGTSKIVTPPFPFPVEICAGCLTTKPECTFDDDNDPGTAPVPVEPIPGDVCVPGQDFPSFVCP